jgi:Fe-S cluster assembly protein SufD
MNNTAKADLKSKIIEEFNTFESKLNGEKNSIIHNVRKAAFDRFVLNGFPNQKVENWKYNHLSFLRTVDFDFNPDTNENDLPEGLIDKLDYEHLDADLIVFVNGKISDKYSQIIDKDYISIRNIRDSYDDEFVQNHFGQIADLKNHPFADINTAFTHDGLYVKIEENYVADKPLHILNITDAREKDVFVNARKLIFVGKNSELNILESHYLLGENKGLVNVVNEIKIAANSKIDYYKIQNFNDNMFFFSATKALQDEDSVFNKTTISLDGKFIRNDIHAQQNGKNCETNYFGFFYAKDQNSIDNHTFVDHATADCTSNEKYKGIITDRGTGIFNGKILVRQDAQRINAYQSNMNILLSDDATINTKPELEIYADDVKCSHGATSGSLDEEQLFYLISRGIEPETARNMLLNAFAGDILSHIKIDKVRDIVENKINDTLDIH